MITLKDLSYAYPGQKESSALKDVSLHIESGECVVLCGRSGCGKTTLLRTVNGLIPHFHGGTVTGKAMVADLERVPESPYADFSYGYPRGARVSDGKPKHCP